MILIKLPLVTSQNCESYEKTSFQCEFVESTERESRSMKMKSDVKMINLDWEEISDNFLCKIIWFSCECLVIYSVSVNRLFKLGWMIRLTALSWLNYINNRSRSPDIFIQLKLLWFSLFYLHAKDSEFERDLAAKSLLILKMNFFSSNYSSSVAKLSS
jgi:hypothetical protein